MSLLKALHAATTLAAVQDLLATQVLTTEDLATADVYDLSEAIRSKGNAVCIFTRDDLDGRFDGTPAEAETWLSDNARRIGDRLSETGNQVIDDLLSADGLDKDDDNDDEIDEVEALIYGAAGHPSRQVEGARTVLFSDRNGYFYVDEVQGGERYTIATGLTQEQATAIENGAEVSDFKWTLKRDGRTDAYFNTYTDAHEAANSGGAVPFRIIPPLAEREPDFDYGEGA